MSFLHAGRTHRRTRSIEGLGANFDASETFRAELERIGSMGSNGSAKPSVQPTERPALALSPPKAPKLGPQPPSCHSSLGSPLRQPMRKSTDAIPPLNLTPVAATQQVIHSWNSGQHSGFPDANSMLFFCGDVNCLRFWPAAKMSHLTGIQQRA